MAHGSCDSDPFTDVDISERMCTPYASASGLRRKLDTMPDNIACIARGNLTSYMCRMGHLKL